MTANSKVQQIKAGYLPGLSDDEVQWHVLHWGVEHRHKMVEWSHRLGEHQAGVLDANVIAAMGWQQGE